MTEVLLALGTNVGDRAKNLQAAIDMLKERAVAVHGASSVWETAPVPADQPPFLNAVVRADTSQTPRELLDTVKSIEWDLGRRPGRRWGPRPIDIDILFYGADEVDEPDLLIPHAHIADRVFVLAPLAEVWEGALPVLGATASELLAGIGPGGAERTTLKLSV